MAGKQKKSENRGGYRPGAGRKAIDPKKRSIGISVTLSPAALRKVDQAARRLGVNRSKVIVQLIGEHL